MVMQETRSPVVELGLISAMGGLLGLGVGFLLSGGLRRDRRVVIGWALATIGALGTIPVVVRGRRARGLAPDGVSRRRPTITS